MAPAVYDTISVEILAGLPEVEERPYLFRASGSSLRFKGFLAVYEEAKDEDTTDEEERKREEIPPLTVNEVVDLVQLLPDQHFTQPPPRYSEATLVRALEEYGIGRPSTYAPIMSTIQQRGYVERRERRLYPTEVGIVVNDLLVEHFPDYIDVGFTAQMEEDLDLIASGKREWVPVLHDFYDPFSTALSEAQEKMPTVQGETDAAWAHVLQLRQLQRRRPRLVQICRVEATPAATVSRMRWVADRDTSRLGKMHRL